MALGLPLAQLSTELSVEALQLWVEVLLSSVQEYEYLSEMEYSLEVWEYWSEARALAWMLPSGDGCLLT